MMSGQNSDRCPERPSACAYILALFRERKELEIIPEFEVDLAATLVAL